MSSAVWDLQQAVHATLAADTAVLALLGTARVYDDVPARRRIPLRLARHLHRARLGHRHRAGHRDHLHACTPGRAAPATRARTFIAEAARDALHDQPLTLADHRLVNLRHDSSETRRERDGDTYRVIARFRAVLEPTP